jgi:hypothetical protein
MPPTLRPTNLAATPSTTTTSTGGACSQLFALTWMLFHDVLLLMDYYISTLLNKLRQWTIRALSFTRRSSICNKWKCNPAPQIRYLLALTWLRRRIKAGSPCLNGGTTFSKSVTLAVARLPRLKRGSPRFQGSQFEWRGVARSPIGDLQNDGRSHGAI